jgi:hypothetical protein
VKLHLSSPGPRRRTAAKRFQQFVGRKCHCPPSLFGSVAQKDFIVRILPLLQFDPGVVVHRLGVVEILSHL